MQLLPQYHLPGNVAEQELYSIWKDKGFSRFRKQKSFESGQCVVCLKRSIETMDTALQIDPDSMRCRWQFIHEGNKERAAARRMAERMRKER